MTRKLTTTGNSVAFVLTRDLRDHLGITDAVDVVLKEGEIVLRKPMSVEDASRLSGRKYRNAYRKLSE